MARLTDYQKDCIARAKNYLSLIPGSDRKQWLQKPGLICNIIEQFNRSNMPLTLFAEQVGINVSTLALFTKAHDSLNNPWPDLLMAMESNKVTLRKSYSNAYGEIQSIILKEIDKQGKIEKQTLLNRLKNLEYADKFAKSAITNLINQQQIVVGSMGYGLEGYFRKALPVKAPPTPSRVVVPQKINSVALAKEHFKEILKDGISEEKLNAKFKAYGRNYQSELTLLIEEAIANGELEKQTCYKPSSLREKLQKLKTKVPSLIDQNVSINKNLQNLKSKWGLSNFKAVENQIDSLLMLTE